MRVARTREQRRQDAIDLMAEGSPLSTGLALIEELMLLANETVARWCRSGRIGAIRLSEDGQWRVPAPEVAMRLLDHRDTQGDG